MLIAGNTIHLVIILLFIVIASLPVAYSWLSSTISALLAHCLSITSSCGVDSICCSGCFLGHFLHDTDLVEEYLWLVLYEFHFLIIVGVHVVLVSQVLLLLFAGVIRCSRGGLASKVDIFGS